MIKKNAAALALAGLIVTIDQITKWLVKNFMEPNEFVSIIDRYVGLRFIMNPGMALGIQIGDKLFFTVFAAIASVIILFFLFRLRADHVWTRLALASILGGAVGNLIDRIFFGKVVDFIEINPWPIFNFADIAITVGMFILIFVVFLERKEEKELQEEEFEIR